MMINKSDLIDGIYIDDRLNVLPYKNKYFQADEIHKIIDKSGMEYLIAQIGLHAYEVLQQKLFAGETEFELPVEVTLVRFCIGQTIGILINTRDLRGWSRLYNR